MGNKESNKVLQKIILDGYQRYHDWWSPIDIAGGSFLAPMTLLWFCEYLLKFEDDEWFDRWLDKDKFIISKGGDKREAKIYMKKFILQTIIQHHTGWINLHDKENRFKELVNHPNNQPQQNELMRRLEEITQQEIDKVNEILSGEYNYHSRLKLVSDIEYQCFSKSHAIYSGYGVIKVYEYLKSIGINVL